MKTKNVIMLVLTLIFSQIVYGQPIEKIYNSCRQEIDRIYRQYGADTLVKILNNDKEDWGNALTCRNCAMHLLKDQFNIPTELLINSLNTYGEGGRILICGVFERSRDEKTDSIAAYTMAKLILEDISQTVKSWAAMALQELNYKNSSIINDALIRGMLEGRENSTFQCAKALSTNELTKDQKKLIYNEISKKNLKAIYYLQFKYHIYFDEFDKEIIIQLLSDNNALFLERVLEQMKYTYRKYTDKQIHDKLLELSKHKSNSVKEIAKDILSDK